MAKLSSAQIAQRLRALAGWEYKDNAISRLFRFRQFMDGIEFVNRIAKIAEATDHHPDITINYTRVRFSCTTHSEGGVTDRDFTLAGEINKTFDSLAQ
jgi:4a-hydroxytetrahydrobiopterin dehydratase